MLHTDLPSSHDIETLASVRSAACISIYLPTTPLRQSLDATRIELSNAFEDAVSQLEEAGHDKREVLALRALVDDFIDDADFWQFLSNSLAIFVTSTSLTTFRLPNELVAALDVSDRFYIKPLLRALTFPQAAFVLAISQNAVRLIQVTPDSPAFEVAVADLPRDAAQAVGLPSISGRAPSGRIQGSEGLKVRLHQYSRAVDRSIRPILSGQSIPLIIAASEPLASIYRSANTYPRLAEATIDGNAEITSDADLASAARVILDELYTTELGALRELMEQRANSGRAATDLTDVARAATFGAVDTLFVDIDRLIPGVIDEQTGVVTLAEVNDAVSYGVVDEIARRALRSGARVVAVRGADVPGGGAVAAILRFAV